KAGDRIFDRFVLDYFLTLFTHTGRSCLNSMQREVQFRKQRGEMRTLFGLNDGGFEALAPIDQIRAKVYLSGGHFSSPRSPRSLVSASSPRAVSTIQTIQ